MIQRANLIGIISIINILELACCFALIFYGAAGILNDDVPQRFVDYRSLTVVLLTLTQSRNHNFGRERYPYFDALLLGLHQ
jgi:hypothetical protein